MEGEDRAGGDGFLCAASASFALQDGRTPARSYRHPEDGLILSVATVPQIPSLTNRAYLLGHAFPGSSVHKVSLHILHAIFTL
jgi:hypothetical protein